MSRNLYWEISKGALLCIAMLFLMAWLVTCSAAEFEPFAQYDHTSDIRRGPPFNDRDEHTQDFIGGGVTISAGKHRAWEIDLSHGYKTIDCRSCWETGSRLSVRFYPRRLK